MFVKVLCLAVALTQLSVLAADPLVELPEGQIQGREDVTINGKTYYAFERIPFAAPPVGKLRFQAPVPPEKWEGVLNTTHIDVSCVQVMAGLGLRSRPPQEDQSEDCLFLNVFTPQLLSDESSTPLPVMVFIYGGGFMGGSSSGYRSDFIIDEDVILVTINYRTNIFGFLSTHDDVIPGNAGLKDQHLALQWVQQNIDLFGGDPDQVTIFGQSAGSASVAYHLLNQKSEGLFRGAIMESGSFLMPSVYQRNAREIAFATGAYVDDTFSSSNDSAALLELLQSLDTDDVIAAAAKYLNAHAGPEFVEIFQGIPYGPVIEAKNDNAFITKKQYGLLQAGNVVKVPVISGITSEEALGLFGYSNEQALTKNLQIYDEHPEWVPPADMITTDESQREELGSAIRDVYTGGSAFSGNFGAGARYYSDNGFTRAAITQARFYSQYAPTYFYQFSYDGELGGNDLHYDGAESVGHAEDLNYIFCLSGSCDLSGYSEADQLTSQRLVKLWTNFAKYQHPTPEPEELLQNLTWPEVSVEDGGDFQYVDISDDLEIKTNPKGETYSKWVQLYDSLGYTDFDTY